METRKITVILESGNGTRVIETGAETLGELKRDLLAAGIDYSGKIIREGLSRTELIDNASLLPKDVPFRGQTTNNLVFTLITENKHIKSGGMTRAEAYEAVKKAGLQEAIKREFGRNFTQVGTSELEAFLMNNAVAETPAPRSEEAQASCNCGCEGVKAAFLQLVEILKEDGTIWVSEAEELIAKVDSSSNCSCDDHAPSAESPWSADDLAAIIAGIR